MNKVLLSFGALLLGLLGMVLPASGQTYSWAVNESGSQADATLAITTDINQNVYSYISFTGSITLDSAGVSKTFTGFGNKDIAIIKKNCLGEFQWAVIIGSPNIECGDFNLGGLASDSSGNIYASGSFRGMATFVSANGTSISRGIAVVPTTIDDAFIMKINNAGIVQWVNTASSSADDEAGRLRLDNRGNIYFTGMFSNNCVFTSVGGSPVTLTSNGNTDIFVAKYSPSGELLLTLEGGAAFQDIGYDVDIDSTGNIYVCGAFGSGGAGGINLGNIITNNGGFGAFIAKADPSGTWLWANSMGSAGDERYYSVRVDDLYDRVYVSGHFTGNSFVTTRPGGSTYALNSAGNYDISLVCMNTNGANQWARSMGGINNDYSVGMTLDKNHNVLIGGEFIGGLTVGTLSISSTGNSSAYILRHSRLNVPLNLYKIGTTSPGFRQVVALHRSSSNALFAGGYFIGANVYFGDDTLTSKGNSDAFTAKIDDGTLTMIRANKTTIQCTGDTSILDIPNKGFGLYRWFRNDTLFTVTTTPKIQTNWAGSYKVVSINGCEPNDTSSSITITKLTTFVTPRLSDHSICFGDSSQIRGNGLYSYTWTPTTGISNPTIFNPWVKSSTNTTYFATISYQGCTARDTINVIVFRNCCLTCATPYEINQGLVACYPFNGNAQDESGNGNHGSVIGATLTQDRFGINARAYNFSGTNQFISIPNSSTLSGIDKEVTIMFWARIGSYFNFGGGLFFASAVTKSTANPNYQYRFAIRNDGILTFNNNRQWNVAMGSNTPLAQWIHFAVTINDTIMRYYRNGILVGTSTTYTSITSDKTQGLNLGRGNPNNAGDFFNGRLDEVRIYNRTLTAAEITKLYQLSSINGLPTVNAGTDQNMCKDDSLTINGTGTLIANFLWTPNRSILSDSTTAQTRVWPQDTTQFILQAEVSGCKNYDTVVVNVVDFKPEAGTPQTICYGDTLQVNASAANLYSWSPNLFINNINIQNPKIYSDSSRNYILTANNGLCTRYDTLQLTVNRVVLDPVSDTIICAGDSAQISINTTGILSYFPTYGISDTAVSNPYFKTADSTTYILSSTLAGCTVRDTFTIRSSVLSIEAGPNREICMGDTIQLNSFASPGANFAWLTNLYISDTAVSNPQVFPPATQNYILKAQTQYCVKYDTVHVTVYKAFGNAGPDLTLCLGDTVRFQGFSNGITTWSPTTAILDTGATARLNPTAPTTSYIMNIQQGVCSFQDTVNVTVLTLNVDAGSNQSICLGDSAQLNATGFIKYNWLPALFINDTGIANPKVSPPITSTYYVVVYNGYCYRYDSVQVTVNSVNADAGIDTSACEGTSVRLNASGGTTYQWLTTTGLDNPNSATPLLTPPSSDSWIVKVSDANNCFDLDTVSVRMHTYPSVDAGPDLMHCPDDNVQINTLVNGTYTDLIWTPATGLNDRRAVSPFASVSTPTTYIVEVSNRYCKDFDTVEVSNPPKVVADFDVTPQSGDAPLKVQITNKSQNAKFFLFDFDTAGITSDKRDPEFTYMGKGLYTIRLTVEDSIGCSDTASRKVTVDATTNWFAASAFTPNNDGNNDVFKITYAASEFEYVEYRIYNRWGLEVYSSRMPDGNWWDGRDQNGVAVESGVYTWVASAKDRYGKKYKMDGTVLLLR
ncbi:MAG: gliding motility-associated C-terminal domain-containing protein [Bacteroidetes bacterium]|nr:gliding motility-associated C-terminal domain-containing protein [Bacteroidota bacterium]